MRRALVALCVLGCLAASGKAAAEWSIMGQVEHFKWAESTTPSVTETGPRFGIGATWTQNKDYGFHAGYRGYLYQGSVEYRGALLLSGQPVSGTTKYFGILNEIQGIYSFPNSNLHLLAGLALDVWERQLSADQSEDWSVLFLRLGPEFGTRTKPGWFAGGGVKYPLYIHEDAHLNTIGFSGNEPLRPGREPSLYADLGYRFAQRVTVTAYYDSYRFGESPKVGPFLGPPPCNTGRGCLFFQPASTVDTFGLRLQFSF